MGERGKQTSKDKPNFFEEIERKLQAIRESEINSERKFLILTGDLVGLANFERRLSNK